MKSNSCYLPLAFALAATILTSGAKASADIIDFEQFAGPSTFAAAGPEQTLTVSTFIGDVIVTGGVILTGAIDVPADQTSVYGTAFSGDGLLNFITLTFPQNINNLFLNLYNGETYPETFTVSDNLGDSTTVTLASNLDGGTSLISFPAADSLSVVTVTTTDPAWDFVIDNVGFDQRTPPTVPEPATLTLLGTALVALLSERGCLKRHLTFR